MARSVTHSPPPGPPQPDRLGAQTEELSCAASPYANPRAAHAQSSVASLWDPHSSLQPTNHAARLPGHRPNHPDNHQHTCPPTGTARPTVWPSMQKFIHPAIVAACGPPAQPASRPDDLPARLPTYPAIRPSQCMPTCSFAHPRVPRSACPPTHISIRHACQQSVPSFSAIAVRCVSISASPGLSLTRRAEATQEMGSTCHRGFGGYLSLWTASNF